MQKMKKLADEKIAAAEASLVFGSGLRVCDLEFAVCQRSSAPRIKSCFGVG